VSGARKAFMSIGEVLGQLRAEFPDVTISKIRFLEAEGLIEPERTSSGYRKFSRDDVARLRYVLAAQRDHYLPLRVIKAHLEALDRGLEPSLPGETGPRVPQAVTASAGVPGPDAFLHEASDVRLSRDELATAAGLTAEQLAQLEQYGLVGPRQGSSYYDGDALIVAKTVAEMSRYGIEARHLRPFKSAADREIGLFEQVVNPLVRQRNPEARTKADEVVRELAALSMKLHSTLVRAGLRPGLTR
jgi:DNA-binding transcriptional MerR regulator